MDHLENSLAPDEQAFVNRRWKLARAWNYAGVGLLLLLAGLLGWQWGSTPLLVNPAEVSRRLEAGTIEASSLETMALLLPVMTLVCLSVLAVFVVLGFVIFANERRLIRIIRRLSADREAVSESS